MRALVVRSRYPQRLAPVQHGTDMQTPPVGHGRRRLVPNCAGQFVVDEEPASATRWIEGQAAGPGDAGVAPADDHDGVVTDQAERPVAAP